MLVRLKLPPTLTLAGAPVRLVMVRSGPTWICEPRMALLASFDSETWLAESAMAPRKYVPGARPAGTVTVVAAVLVAPAARLVTDRVPMGVSDVVMRLSVER